VGGWFLHNSGVSSREIAKVWLFEIRIVGWAKAHLRRAHHAESKSRWWTRLRLAHLRNSVVIATRQLDGNEFCLRSTNHKPGVTRACRVSGV
jgi:hypothetical protein